MGQSNLSVVRLQDGDLVSRLSDSENYIREVMHGDPNTIIAEAEEESRMQQQALETLEGIRGEYAEITRSIMNSSRGALTVRDGWKDFKKQDGLKDKAAALWHMGGTVVEKTPILGHAKIYAQHKWAGDTNVAEAIQRQLEIVTKLRDNLGTYLFGADKNSLRTNFITTRKRIDEKQAHSIELKKLLEERKSQETSMSSEFADRREELKAKGVTYDKINPDQIRDLSAADSEIYFRAKNLEAELTQVKADIEVTDKELDLVYTSLAGKEVTLNFLIYYQIAGQHLHSHLSDFLKESREDIGAISVVAETERLIVEGARQAHILKTHYNRLLVTTAKHGATIAANKDALIPESLYDKAALIESLRHIQSGAQHYLHGTENVRNATEALVRLADESFTKNRVGNGNGYT